MSYPTKAAIVAVFFMSTVLGPAQAASVSYFLDQSSIDAQLPDGQNYLQVTIADGSDGDIDFTVEILDPLLSIAGANFGIQSFGFNTTSGVFAGTIEGPGGWATTNNKNQNGFGRFFVVKKGQGNSRQSPILEFSISGVDGDTPFDYVALSSGNADQGNQFFAAHVAGFRARTNDKAKGQGMATSGFFGGSAIVPVPPAAWLFGSALALLGWVRRMAI